MKWRYGEVLGDKSKMHIRVTLHWGHLIVMWLFHLVCILYCGCLNLFCNVWMSVCRGVRQLCGCFGNMCICIYCVWYFLYCVFVLLRLCVFILICFIGTSVRTTATEWQHNFSNNNNNNNRIFCHWVNEIPPHPARTLRCGVRYDYWPDSSEENNDSQEG